MNKAHAEAIIIALKNIDFEDDAAWTSDDLPRLDVVSQLAGIRVNRQQLEEVAPGFTRQETAYFEDEDDGEGTPDEGETVDPSTLPDEQQPEDDKPEDGAGEDDIEEQEETKETADFSDDDLQALLEAEGFDGTVEILHAQLSADSGIDIASDDFKLLEKLIGDLNEKTLAERNLANNRYSKAVALADIVITIKERQPVRTFAEDVKLYQKRQQEQRQRGAAQEEKIKEIISQAKLS